MLRAVAAAWWLFSGAEEQGRNIRTQGLASRSMRRGSNSRAPTRRKNSCMYDLGLVFQRGQVRLHAEGGAPVVEDQRPEEMQAEGALLCRREERLWACVAFERPLECDMDELLVQGLADFAKVGRSPR